jgi:hypothetical protein
VLAWPRSRRPCQLLGAARALTWSATSRCSAGPRAGSC